MMPPVCGRLRYYPCDADFTGMQNAKVIGSWPVFKRRPGRTGKVLGSLPAALERMMQETIRVK
jgi:hypothetical protein